MSHGLLQKETVGENNSKFTAPGRCLFSNHMVFRFVYVLAIQTKLINNNRTKQIFAACPNKTNKPVLFNQFEISCGEK